MLKQDTFLTVTIIYNPFNQKIFPHYLCDSSQERYSNAFLIFVTNFRLCIE